MGKVVSLGMAASSRSSTVAVKSATASGFFYITGPRYFGTCAKAAANELLKCLGLDGDLVRLNEPHTHSLVGGKSFPLVEVVLQIGKN